MSIRIATPNDAEAIGVIQVSAWKAAYKNFMPAQYLASLDPTEHLNQRRDFLENTSEATQVYVAERDTTVVGFSILGLPRYPTTPGTLELWALNVLPEYWKMGIGTELIQAALEQASNRQFSTMELWCIKGNRAAETAYQRNGFCATRVERTTSHLTGYPLHEVLFSNALISGS